MVQTSDPVSALAAVAAALPEPPHRPLLVAVDGGDGAGKSTFAEAVAGELRRLGRDVDHTSLVWFHHPLEHRRRHGRTPEAVWSRHFDYRAVRRELLDPWLKGPGALYRSRWHDVTADAFVEQEPRAVPDGAVLVVDGVFAQRPELRDVWDLVVYVHADDEVRVERMAARDGGPADPEHPDQLRYLLAQRHYRTVCDPIGLADIVVDNNVDFVVKEIPHPARQGAGAGDRVIPSNWRMVPGSSDAVLERTLRLPASAVDLAARINQIVDEYTVPD